MAPKQSSSSSANTSSAPPILTVAKKYQQSQPNPVKPINSTHSSNAINAARAANSIGGVGGAYSPYNNPNMSVNMGANNPNMSVNMGAQIKLPGANSNQQGPGLIHSSHMMTQSNQMVSGINPYLAGVTGYAPTQLQNQMMMGQGLAGGNAPPGTAIQHIPGGSVHAPLIQSQVQQQVQQQVQSYGTVPPSSNSVPVAPSTIVYPSLSSTTQYNK